MFSIIAELAYRLARRAQRIAAARIGNAHRANARAEFWTDVQAWADGIDDWHSLRTRRRARHGSAMRTITLPSPLRIQPIHVFLALLIAFAIVAAWMSLMLASAHAEEKNWAHADPKRSAWFKSLTVPGTGGSCCDISDCRRTEAEWKDGRWWAAVAMPDKTSKWMPIEPGRVLAKPRSIDGEAYVCSSAGSVAGPAFEPGIGAYTRPASDPLIYCSVPPDMGS